MNAKVKEVLASILDRFRNNDIPEAIAYSMFPIPNIPSAKWSLLNRMIMLLSGTRDARGFRQWLQAKRYVKKGSKAFYILVPYLKKVEDEETGEETEILKGFMAKPVFRYEDTEGEALEYERVELPKVPLMEKAEEWGISVKAIPGNYGYYGYYSSSNKAIGLASQEECVFFHELAHCAHEKVNGTLKNGQDPVQEIVAELSAQALCRIVGKQPHDTLGNSYSYIELYAEKLKTSPYTACLRVLSDTEKVLNLILKEGREYDLKTTGKECQATSLPKEIGADIRISTGGHQDIHAG
jgi:antirestriction protein ArdC